MNHHKTYAYITIAVYASIKYTTTYDTYLERGTITFRIQVIVCDDDAAPAAAAATTAPIHNVPFGLFYFEISP